MEGPELDIRVLSDGTPLHAIMARSRFTPAGGEGVRIVAQQSQGSLWLWDPEGGGAARALEGHTGCVSPLVCIELTSAPHERWVAAADRSAVVRLWEAEGGRMVGSLSGHTARRWWRSRSRRRGGTAW
jgi:WD40 repeat protein